MPPIQLSYLAITFNDTICKSLILYCKVSLLQCKSLVPLYETNLLTNYLNLQQTVGVWLVKVILSVIFYYKKLKTRHWENETILLRRWHVRSQQHPFMWRLICPKLLEIQLKLVKWKKDSLLSSLFPSLETSNMPRLYELQSLLGELSLSFNWAFHSTLILAFEC